MMLRELVRVLPGVDHDDAVLGEDDAAVGLEAPSGVDVDAVGELLDLRTEILRARRADERTARRKSPALLPVLILMAEMVMAEFPPLVISVEFAVGPSVALSLSVSNSGSTQPRRRLRAGRQRA